MSSDTPEQPEVTPDVFRPSWLRVLFAAVVAVGAFFIPQEIPLEWYPLNNPSSGLQYLEITCASNVTGTTEIFLDTGRGFNELDKISWPIGPSEMAFTYTFPLADAPLFNIRLDPLIAGPGEFTITNFRLINRRNEEIRRFTPAKFFAAHNIAAITPLEKGWKIVTAKADDPNVQVQLDRPSIAEGMSDRNLKRCLLSTSYLTLMLWIILLAVFFAFRRPEPWRHTLSSMGFLCLLSLFFSFVGNRGLIRNSIRFARVTPPWTIEIDLTSPHQDVAQLFWDTGRGFSEVDSARSAYEASDRRETLRFALPAGELRALRLDPADDQGRLTIHAIRITDGKTHTLSALPPDSFTGVHSIAKLDPTKDGLTVESAANEHDPILLFTPSAVEKINLLRRKTK